MKIDEMLLDAKKRELKNRMLDLGKLCMEEAEGDIEPDAVRRFESAASRACWSANDYLVAKSLLEERERMVQARSAEA